MLAEIELGPNLLEVCKHGITILGMVGAWLGLTNIFRIGGRSK